MTEQQETLLCRCKCTATVSIDESWDGLVEVTIARRGHWRRWLRVGQGRMIGALVDPSALRTQLDRAEALANKNLDQ